MQVILLFNAFPLSFSSTKLKNSLVSSCIRFVPTNFPMIDKIWVWLKYYVSFLVILCVSLHIAHLFIFRNSIRVRIRSNYSLAQFMCISVSQETMISLFKSRWQLEMRPHTLFKLFQSIFPRTSTFHSSAFKTLWSIKICSNSI